MKMPLRGELVYSEKSNLHEFQAAELSSLLAVGETIIRAPL